MNLPNQIKGAIFDIDDTLLDNRRALGTIHELSRLQAIKQVAGLLVCAITTRFPANHEALLAAKPDLIVDSFQEIMDHIRVRK